MTQKIALVLITFALFFLALAEVESKKMSALNHSATELDDLLQQILNDSVTTKESVKREQYLHYFLNTEESLRKGLDSAVVAIKDLTISIRVKKNGDILDVSLSSSIIEFDFREHESKIKEMKSDSFPEIFAEDSIDVIFKYLPEKVDISFQNAEAKDWQSIYRKMSDATFSIIAPIAAFGKTELHNRVFYGSDCYPIILAYIRNGDSTWFRLGLELYRKCDASSCSSYRKALHDGLMANPEQVSRYIKEIDELQAIVVKPVIEEYENADKVKQYLEIKRKSIRTRYPKPSIDVSRILQVIENKIEEMNKSAREEKRK